MRRVDEGIINKLLRKLRIEQRGSQGFGFKIFHEKIDNNKGDQGTHGNTTSLFIELTFKAKKGRGEENLYQLG